VRPGFRCDVKPEISGRSELEGQDVVVRRLLADEHGHSIRRGKAASDTATVPNAEIGIFRTGTHFLLPLRHGLLRWYDATVPDRATHRKLALLLGLYFVQGLPFGFQVTAVPTLLRQQGVSLVTIGSVSMLLSLPWLLKILWAPLVDRFYARTLGRRRSWILPMQAALVFCYLAAAFFNPLTHLPALLALVFVMNTFAATMDIAVDGWAVDLLEPSELGYGNIGQVVGFKLGMLVGGGVALYVSASIRWAAIFPGLAFLVALVLLSTFRARETARPILGTSYERSPIDLRKIVTTVGRSLVNARGLWLLLFVATYKLGETLADRMFKPFLVDLGFTTEQMGWWAGIWAISFSLAGSFFGGVLASRIPLLSAVTITAVLRVAPLAGEWWISIALPGEQIIAAVIAAEHFFGGALTTAVFALMMSRVEREVGATHYTALATVEVLGKYPLGPIAGWIADRFGYSAVFATATLISAAFPALLIPLRERR